MHHNYMGAFMQRLVAVLFTSLLTLLGAFLFPINSQAATPPPSFAGEELVGGNDGFDPPRALNVTCNPDGSGSATYDVTGVAYGPYPGTFQESGSLTFGPFVDSAGQSNVTSFEASFRVESPLGIVHGDKSLIPNDAAMEPIGYCTRPTNPDPDVANGATIMTFQGQFRWDVTITTEDSVYAESGTGFATGHQLLTVYYHGGIQERFTSSTTGGPVFVAPRTPTSAEQCKQNGYAQYGIFKNQGDCIAFVETLGRNEPGQNIPG